MAITCADLLQLKTFKSIKLVAGQNGLNRQLTWPHVCQTASVSDWVHGGELLFITGLAHTVADLEGVLQECILKRLAGLVILTGDQYIQQIPSDLINKAEQASFPVFEMPWNLKLIDVTREITDLIAIDKLERKRSKTFLSKLLFSDSLDLTQLSDEQALHDINIQERIFIAIFNIVDNAVENIAKPESVEENIQDQIHSLCKQNNINIHSLLYGNNIICLVSASEFRHAEKSSRYLRTIHELLTQINPDIDLYLSFGRIYNSPAEIRRSYHEAKQSLDLCKRVQMDNHIIFYSDLGVYRLFLNIKDIKEIQAFVDYYLEPILEYDELNCTELLPTLRQYLYCNAHLANTAKAMFIHRNTLLYRLNQIRDLLNIDLDDATSRLNLFNSIIAKDYLGK